MKKSTKITLIIAIVLMVVGGTVALVCLLLGGDLDEVSYNTNVCMYAEHYNSTTH